MLWQSFFDGIGIKTMTSHHTNQPILDLGLRHSINELCLPVKVYVGHVMDLKDRVDYLFIPRYTSIHSREYICPKFGGLPDMIRNTIQDLPPIIDSEINLRESKKNSQPAIHHIADTLGINRKEANKAYQHAVNDYIEYRKKQQLRVINSDHLNILLMGHPYIVDDSFINANIQEKIKQQDGEIVTLEMFDPRMLRKHASALTKPMFWSYGTQALGCAYYLINKGDIDGIIYLSSFGCGIDSFVSYMVERRIRNESNIPFTTITLDEHSAEAGLETRIEAFMDTIKWRQLDESHISTHG